VPTLDQIFNVVAGDADRAHGWRMNRGQFAYTYQLPD
jgi:hypothetical protein